MSLTDTSQTEQNLGDGKARIILAGAFLGALFGALSSYLYTRAAEENGNAEAGGRGSVSTGQVLAVLLAMLGLARQIAELGKSKKDEAADKK